MAEYLQWRVFLKKISVIQWIVFKLISSVRKKRGFFRSLSWLAKDHQDTTTVDDSQHNKRHLFSYLVWAVLAPGQLYLRPGGRS